MYTFSSLTFYSVRPHTVGVFLPSRSKRPLLDAVRRTGSFLYRGEPLGEGGGGGGPRAVVEVPDLFDEGRRRWLPGICSEYYELELGLKP